MPALPANLLESELFGHERGCFTGADRQKLGKFELANGGTLFLDEIGESGARPAGEAAPRPAGARDRARRRASSRSTLDVRVICATNRDLRSGCQEGQFREDLY